MTIQLDLTVIPAPGRTSYKDHKFKISVSSTCRPCCVWVSANPRASRVINGPCEARRNPVLSDLVRWCCFKVLESEPRL